jgi:D-aminoacyl-tRNA deacylase
MNLIVTSKEDIASMNIRDFLLSTVGWEDSGSMFDGSPILTYGNFNMILIQDIHLHFEELDVRLKEETGIEPECIIFASRHRSESGLRTLTVHPLGNYGEAAFGGSEGLLVPTIPRLMSQALLSLRKNASALDFEVSFECTHHGPFLQTPTFFIEIGSDESAWPEKPVGEILAKTILELDSPKDTKDDIIAVGVGGGHYAPRHSDVALNHKISMGHMVPNYALEHLDEDMARQVVDRTPGCEVVYFHRKSMKKPRYRELKELFEGLGLKTVRSANIGERL